jgi:exoribonuclease R
MMLKLYTKDYKTFGRNGEIPLEKIDRGLPGDEMELSIGKEKWIVTQRAEHPTLVGLLDVKSKYVYGMSSRGTSQYLFTPYNESYPPFIVGCADKDKRHNKIVLVRFSDWPVGSKFPKGQLIQTLGVAGDFEAEAKALYWCYSPWTFKKEPTVMARPKAHGLSFIKEEENENDEDDNEHDDRLSSISSHPNRLDLTQKYTLNIDPLGCKDIDDVLTVYHNDSNSWVLVVTIADVSEMIDVNGELDHHAMKTGQSLYSEFLPPRNMLLPQLSEDELSLIPGKTRFGVSLIHTFSGNKLMYSKFAESIIENKASYTYDNVEATADPEVVKMIRQAAGILGCEDINDPHKWIETFMVNYNKSVAKELYDKNVGIFRGQKPDVPLEKYQRICPELAHQAAIFTGPEDILEHTSLNAPTYCYASSPIRRYVDIVNQRLLKIIISKQWEFLFLSRDDDFSGLADKMNDLQKGAKRQSRDDFFLSQLAGEKRIIEGVIFDIATEKLKVYVPVWKRFVKVRREQKIESTTTLYEGEKVNLRYFYNPDQVAWKNRIVFQIV